jgi:exosome complex exonuclease RRP6
LDPVLRHASHLPKPQLLFKTKVDNQDNSPWRPNLAHKYNAQVPLGHNYSDADNINETTLHPYQYEIKHITYPDRMFQYSLPIPPNTFEETPFSWISTAAEFASMLDKLRSAKEIAVDLEHHSYRTWAGFLCLMQITTREEDFVVDTITLREELQELNEVFTDPRIVKVNTLLMRFFRAYLPHCIRQIFHGAAGDICWLQQDFDLYIVNLFDTYHASQLLGNAESCIWTDLY